MNPCFMILLMIALLVVFFLLGLHNEKTTDAALYQKILKQFHNRLNRDYSQRDFDICHQSLLDYLKIKGMNDSQNKGITSYYEKSQYFLVDDITWNDLELDEILKHLDFSYSQIGLFGFYKMLRFMSFDPEKLKKREDFISFFYNHDKVAAKFLLQSSKLSFHVKESIFDFYNKKDQKMKLPVISIAADFCLALFLILALAFSSNFWFGFIFVIMFQMLFYSKRKHECDSVIQKIGFILSLIDQLSVFLKYKKDFDASFDDIFVRMEDIYSHNQKNYRLAFVFQLSSSKSATGDIFKLIIIYLNMIFHFDVILAYFMQKDICLSMDEIVELIDLIGEIEACISIAHIRSCFEKTSIPQLFCEKNYSNAFMKDLYHPLIKDPVYNHLEFIQSVLLTGSNASGKSTFMKSVALNILFAQTMHTAFASTYCGPYTTIYSSMALRDNLLLKESYFVVELKSMKRILDGIACDEPAFVVIDEILRGTNTSERIAASTALLKSLESDRIFVIAATHDVELTQLLEPDFANYHFSETVKDGQITFPYELEEGPATGRNAIALMECFGYPKEIIKNANLLAGN